MDGFIRSSVRRALGLHTPALSAPREVFFGTRRTLLQVFGMAIRHRQALDEARQVARRKGVSAKSPYAMAMGNMHLPAGNKLARKVGRGGLNFHPTTPVMRAYQNIEMGRRAARGKL